MAWEWHERAVRTFARHSEQRAPLDFQAGIEIVVR